MLTTHTPITSCPHCGATIDAAASVLEDARPSMDDLTMCMSCGEFSVFDHNLELRKPNSVESIEIQQNEDCILVKRAWFSLQLREKRGVH